ncbi:MAG: hypothetical protein IPO05_15325 [Flavobacteriales bacterium]|jgi:hypothetical protein|nr:hypothetical protein [Flavobacteriales bacterium]MBP7448675.1 hypothetical protein [Flavobacteriales bacterium]
MPLSLPLPLAFRLLLPLLLSIPLHAQTWELVTPVMTRSDLAAVYLRSPL